MSVLIRMRILVLLGIVSSIVQGFQRPKQRCSRNLRTQQYTRETDDTAVLLLAETRRTRPFHPVVIAAAVTPITASTSAAFAALVPVDISSLDTIAASRIADLETQAALLPDITVNTLDGGFNLGILLFTYVLYNGFFGKAGRPAEWVLPAVAKATGEEEKEWFIDFKDGFAFELPPLVEAVRVVFFALLAYGVESAWVAAFDGDTFWGWSTGVCLFLPSSLINLSRDARATREEYQFESQLKDAFEQFASARLTRGDRSLSCNELNIIIGFRRAFSAYRTEDEVSDKALRKLIRRWVGYKCGPDGKYIGLGLSNKKKEAREALERAMRSVAADRSRIMESNDDVEEEDEEDGEGEVAAIPRPKTTFDNEFVRK